MMDPITADILKQAVPLAQAGQMDEAKSLAENGLVAGGDKVALNAFLGMISARQGQMADAVRHLQLAHDGKPEDITIACNLIATLIESGDMPTALAVATGDLAFGDATLRVARYRAFLAQSLEQFEEAVACYEHILAQNPADFEALNNLGNAKGALGDLAGSVDALERAVAIEPDVAPTRLNLATALSNSGRFDEAENHLGFLLSANPDDTRALHALYVLYKGSGRNEAALEKLEQAVNLDGTNANLLLKLGIEYGHLMRIADSEAAYRKAVVNDPQLADAYLGLAIQYEHSNREEEFAPLIALAEENGVEGGALAFLQSLEHRRSGRFQEALDCLDRVPEPLEPERTSHIRATLLDRLDRTEEAFAAFERTAALHMEHPSNPLPRAARARDQLRDEIKEMTPDWVAGWQVVEQPDEGKDPVFLVGFPRSGTTLLDTILMGHDAVHVMEERPPLNHVDHDLGGMDAIASLDANQIADARARYFKEAREKEGWDGTGMLVDKSPLFLQKVPLIHRLFPNAKFILALRHPCDVLLSCYMSNFRLNDAMSNFLRLDDAAEYYDLTFRHWMRARELLPIKVHNICYENLVENVEAEVRPLFEFLELPWDSSVLDHQRTAKSRGLITTASYSQVAEPIYKRATGRWLRYRGQLASVLPTLRPWIERFGYIIQD